MDEPQSHQKKTARTVASFFKSPWFDTLQFLLLAAILCFIAIKSSEDIGYFWQWYQIPQYIYTMDEGGFIPGPLLEGLLITIKISAISLFFSFLIGLTTAIFRLSNSFIARSLATFYLEISRNTPLLIQIFFIYFVLGPTMGIERFASAVLALSLFEGAYASEIFRAGIQSVDKGQIEAAKSVGLSTFHTYRFVILPQAVRTILPPLTSQAISLIKDSALVSTIAVYDLTLQAQNLVAETYLTFELWFTVALLYLSITLILSLVVGIMEKRFKLQ